MMFRVRRWSWSAIVEMAPVWSSVKSRARGEAKIVVVKPSQGSRGRKVTMLACFREDHEHELA